MALNSLLGLILGQNPNAAASQALPPGVSQMPTVPPSMSAPTSDVDEALKQSLLRTSQMGEKMGADAMAQTERIKSALFGSPGINYPASPDMPGSEYSQPGKPGLFDIQSKLAAASPYHFSDWTDPVTGELHKSTIAGKIGNALAMVLNRPTPSGEIATQERGAVAGQIKSLTDLQKEASQEAATGVSAAYRPAVGAARLESAEAQQTKARAYSQNVVNSFQNRVRELDIRSTLADSTVTLNKARAALDYAEAQYQKDRIQLGYYETDANNESRQKVAAILAQEGLDKDQAGRNIIKAVTGIDWTTKAAIPESVPTPSRPSTIPDRPNRPTPDQQNRATRIKSTKSKAPLGSKDNPIVVK